MESILTSVKKSLPMEEDCKHFDGPLIMHINTVLSILTQVGVGPSSGFALESGTETWDDFVGSEPKFNMVKTYVCQKVKMVFDPPQSSTHMEALKGSIAELEWRLNITE